MNLITKLKQFGAKYKHAVLLSYFVIYIIWFTYLEKTITTKFNPVYSRLDDYIPFNEIFIIPYLIWFVYIALTVAYFFLTSKEDYFKCCANLFIGMTICLIIYSVWPNGHYLRVNLNEINRDNILLDIMGTIYSMDTATNVFPSIHTFNSIAAAIAIFKSDRLRKKVWLQVITILLTISICMATVFLKQHSILDIFGALALNCIMYVIVYVPDWSKLKRNVSEQLSEV